MVILGSALRPLQCIRFIGTRQPITPGTGMDMATRRLLISQGMAMDMGMITRHRCTKLRPQCTLRLQCWTSVLVSVVTEVDTMAVMVGLMAADMMVGITTRATTPRAMAAMTATGKGKTDSIARRSC